ncbi:MAG TPA: type II toxin-antitoxin system VapC family toxin [Candidatus Obscuribacterales bacterium]
MIILDTHIWIWWVDRNMQLTERHQYWINEYQCQGLGVSIISCWEVAKLVEKNRINLTNSVDEWINEALAYPGIKLINLTPSIVIQSTKLVGFHNDPADQIIVATAQNYGCPLLTVDARILKYPNVQVLK